MQQFQKGRDRGSIFIENNNAHGLFVISNISWLIFHQLGNCSIILVAMKAQILSDLKISHLIEPFCLKRMPISPKRLTCPPVEKTKSLKLSSFDQISKHHLDKQQGSQNGVQPGFALVLVVY